MKHNLLIASRPFFSFILLTIGALLIPIITVPWWYSVVKQMEKSIDSDFHQLSSMLQTQLETSSVKLLHPVNSSAIGLARLVASSLNGSDLVPSSVECKVAPLLFNALSVIPYVSHAMYIGVEGSFFSYYYDGNQTFAMYSKSSTGLSNHMNQNSMEPFTSYKQTVDPNTGKPEGVPIKSNFSIRFDASLVPEALNSTNGYASTGRGMNGDEDLLILNAFSVNGRGVVCLGFPAKALADFLHGLVLHGGSLFLVTQDGKELAGGLMNTRVMVNGTSVSLWSLVRGTLNHVEQLSCIPGDGRQKVSSVQIGETKYQVYCSTLEILGVPLVYVLALPYNGLLHTVHRNSRTGLFLLVGMMVGVVISIHFFVSLIVTAAVNDTSIRSALIKQWEATQQAERKNMSKSNAFASASHDILNALAGITGWIEICNGEVSPGSKMKTYLKQMDGCAKDLVGLLNDVLDTRKIEAGKMQLEEEEFNIAYLLEEVVDFYYTIGLRKGVDVVLDACDSSILKFSIVKGDRLWLKRIMCNLVGNAVKFTSEGHVSVRAWAKKPSLQSMIIAGNQNSFWEHFSCLFCKEKEGNDLEAINAVKQNLNYMEFVFEVDDTGKGIPKEKRGSVFENFVQVKETGLGQGGTGLGLGIVQSLVRLMGGEVEIVDRPIGEKGTCFKFNIFLTTSDTRETPNPENDIRTRVPSFTILASSPRLSMICSSPGIDRSRIVLLIQDEERRRTTRKFIESLGIKVSVVEQWECLHQVLRKIKCKNASHVYSSDKSDLGSGSDTSGTGYKDFPLSALDGTDEKVPGNSSSPGFTLLVIDANAGPYQELYRVVSEFKRSIPSGSCKVVWLDKPASLSITRVYQDRIDPKDEILSQPFHGSRLYRIIGLLPEFMDSFSSGSGASSKRKKDSTMQSQNIYKDSVSSYLKHLNRTESVSPSCDVQPLEKQTDGKSLLPDSIQPTATSNSSISPVETLPLRVSEIEEHDTSTRSNGKPLSGMKFLVADDSRVLRKMAMIILKKLGAIVDVCENGEEAVELVRMCLPHKKEQTTSTVVPYDYILMDCVMEPVDGFEATQLIRKEESRYGVHIPIIALTAHSSGDVDKKMVQAGMDAHLVKPLKAEDLLGIIRKIQKI
ncbi:hypothetical protein K2173_009792 [Erythroxylum novogranatense]|uniref:histidine kinase n=1 Tax=Erythroxylum novogranatense TaxID=1862640 RepID=A0AAV8SZW3_9ROSI|nr:hypothetical protein K2173_009792 [Erythroxylum novogranatense]